MRSCTVFFIVFLLSILEAKPLSVQVSAPSAILMNAETGAILYSKEIHERHFPASTTKIATALYVLEKKGSELETLVEASGDALVTLHTAVRQAKDSQHPPYRLEIGGTEIGLSRGEKISLLTLLYGAMLSSGNDAANVLAEATCGTIGRFMEELNLFFKQNGIANTQFTNPHGLHDPNHWTTAYDLAQMARLALKNPLFCEIVKTTRFSKPSLTGKPSQVFPQFNRLLRQGPHFYPRAIGIKTGRTLAAGYTLVAAATHEGRTLIAVLLKCSENTHRYRDAIKLFETAFAEKKITRKLFAKESDGFMHPIRGARSKLRATLKEDLILDYYLAEEPQFRAEIVWEKIELPIAKGSGVGRLRCVDSQENILIEKPLFATDAISKRTSAIVMDFYKVHQTLFLALLLGALVVLLLIYFVKKHNKVGKR